MFTKLTKKDINYLKEIENVSNPEEFLKLDTRLNYCYRDVYNDGFLFIYKNEIVLIYVDPDGVCILKNMRAHELLDNLYIQSNYVSGGMYDIVIYIHKDYIPVTFIYENMILKNMLKYNINDYVITLGKSHNKNDLVIDIVDDNLLSELFIIYTDNENKEEYLFEINTDIISYEDFIIKYYSSDEIPKLDELMNCMTFRIKEEIFGTNYYLVNHPTDLKLARKIKFFGLQYNKELKYWYARKGNSLLIRNYYYFCENQIHLISDDCYVPYRDVLIEDLIVWFGENFEFRSGIEFFKVKRFNMEFKCLLNHETGYLHVVTNYDNEFKNFHIGRYDEIDYIYHDYEFATELKFLHYRPKVIKKYINFAIREFIKKLKYEKQEKELENFYNMSINDLLDLIEKIKEFKFKDSLKTGNCPYGTKNWLMELGFKEDKITPEFSISGKELKEKILNWMNMNKSTYLINRSFYKVVYYKLKKEKIPFEI